MILRLQLECYTIRTDGLRSFNVKMPTPRPESIPKAPAGYAAPPVKNAAPQLKPVEPEVRYTVIARLPFPRGDFVDPPPVSFACSYWARRYQADDPIGRLGCSKGPGSVEQDLMGEQEQ